MLDWKALYDLLSSHLFLLLFAECFCEGGLCLQPSVEHLLSHPPRDDLVKEVNVGLVCKPGAGLLQVVAIFEGQGFIGVVAREQEGEETFVQLCLGGGGSI